MLEISWGLEVTSSMMAELAGVDGLDRLAERSLAGVSNVDDLRVSVVIGHAFRDKDLVPQVTIFAARESDGDATLRLECVQESESSVSIERQGDVSRRSGWKDAFDRAAEVIREAMCHQGENEGGG